VCVSWGSGILLKYLQVGRCILTAANSNVVMRSRLSIGMTYNRQSHWHRHISDMAELLVLPLTEA
jgi:hypothetical protein